ncbi:hypothetical protein [Caulobacter hibisci]|uniref:PH domain-containing protein n=1 Tax=Caulobacter hibisci TaxID=2035993 RepID=A0ABS0SYS0_9CAUL|nr:hypothetical protein [Caulobacter hibisci]MBI1684773.1 hypothetical protein [Caulobacter hibisci]
MTAVETLRAPRLPRGFLIGPLILALLVGLVALVPTPWFIRLGALAVAGLIVGVALVLALPPPWLELDDDGFTAHRRLGRDRRVAWADIERFEIGRTPKPHPALRVLIAVPVFFLTVLSSAGTMDVDVSDTSTDAIVWRKAGSTRTRPDGWITDTYGLAREALLERLEARLAGVRGG